MESILKEIGAVGGVSGAFVCDEVGEVVASTLTGVFDSETMGAVGRTAAQTLSGLQMTRRRKIGEIDLVYAGGRVIVKAMARGYLVILCVRNVNVPLLNLTANMALKKLTLAMGKPKPSEPLAAPAPQATRPASQPAPTAPVAPAQPADPLCAAIPALADLAEALILGVGDMGIGRTSLLTILEPRYRSLMTKYSFLSERSFTFGKINTAHFSSTDVPPAEAVAALGELVNEVYRSGTEFLGIDRAKTLYQRAHQSVTRKNGAALQQPAVLAILPHVE